MVAEPTDRAVRSCAGIALIAGMACLGPRFAAAQAPAAETPATAASAPMTEAMARALRQSRSPYRWILEAGKGRRKSREPVVSENVAMPAPPAAPTPPRPVAAAEPSIATDATLAGPQTLGVVPAAPAATAAAAPTPAAQVTASVMPLANEAPALTPPPAAAAETIEPSLASAPAANATALASAPAPSASAGSGAQAALSPTAAATVAPPAAPADAEPDSIRLVSMVEPEIPQRLLDQVAQGTEFTAELRLHADGTVADVRMLQQLPRNLRRVLEDALVQWRYEPTARPGEPRLQKVQLVFNGNS